MAAGHVRVERFTGLDASVARRGEPFDVELVHSGRKVHVPADRTLLEVLREEGVEVDSSCEGGVCRTCSVHLLGGEHVHRDLVLSAAQRERAMLACVSRGRGVVRPAL